MTNRFWQLRLAWKIIFFKGNPTLQKFSTATAVIAIGIGVASLIITIGVIDGFHAEIKNRILGLSAHVFVRLARVPKENTNAEIEKVTRIITSADAKTQSAPFAITQAMLRAPGATLGVVLKAIDPQGEPNVSHLNKLLQEGSWFTSKSSTDNTIELLLGAEAAKNLGVNVGSKVALILSPTASLAPLMPKIVSARVSGIFQSGYYEYDSSLAYIKLDDALKFFNSEMLLWIGVNGQDPARAAELAKKITGAANASANVISVISWSEMNKGLFSALKLEKIMLTLVISLIIFIASITITSNLIMLAAQKTKLIGSLRSLGGSRRELGYLMLSIGGLLGFLGSLLGLLITGPLIYLIKNTNLVKLPAEIYMIDRLPINLGASEVLLVVLFAWGVSVLASALPAFGTGRLEVSQILRYG